MTTISCPCCGDPMPSAQVVCWTRYRTTNRLTPGVHLDPNGTTATDHGYAITLTQTQIDQWDRARNERVCQGWGALVVAKNVKCPPCADAMAEVVAERDMEAEPFPRG